MPDTSTGCTYDSLLMPRVFLPVPEVRTGVVSIEGENARYLTAVLRCRAGDQVTVSDGGCRSYEGRIIRITRKEVTVEITGAADIRDTESPLQLTLLQ